VISLLLLLLAFGARRRFGSKPDMTMPAVES
jgi:hypothetical protein